MTGPLFTSFIVSKAFHRPSRGDAASIEDMPAALSGMEVAALLEGGLDPLRGSVPGSPLSDVTLGSTLSDIASGRSVVLKLNADLPDSSRAAVVAFLETLVRIGGTVEKNRQEEAIAKLAAIMIPDQAAMARGPIAADNLTLRDRFLAKIPTLSSLQIGERAGHKSGNPYATAARWKKAGDLFAINHRGAEHFPAFQLHDGRPRPAIRPILEALPEMLTPWQRAFWFVSTNGWLDGDAPMDRLDDVDSVVAAARHEAEALIG